MLYSLYGAATYLFHRFNLPSLLFIFSCVVFLTSSLCCVCLCLYNIYILCFTKPGQKLFLYIWSIYNYYMHVYASMFIMLGYILCVDLGKCQIVQKNQIWVNKIQNGPYPLLNAWTVFEHLKAEAIVHLNVFKFRVCFLLFSDWLFLRSCPPHTQRN